MQPGTTLNGHKSSDFPRFRAKTTEFVFPCPSHPRAVLSRAPALNEAEFEYLTENMFMCIIKLNISAYMPTVNNI